jgi:hypothetical protein
MQCSVRAPLYHWRGQGKEQVTTQQREAMGLRGRQKESLQRLSTSGLSFYATSAACRRRGERYPRRRDTVAARESAALLYDGHVAGFVGGATETDDGRERGLCDASRKSEAVQSSVCSRYITHNYTLNPWNAAPETITAQHCLPRLSRAFCPAVLAVPTVPSSPPQPRQEPPHETNEGQWRGLRLMVILACVVTAEEAYGAPL